jgi:hypothetical protein
MKVDAATAEHYVWGNGCDGWHLLKTEGLSVIKERVPPGESERAHLHTKARQFFFISWSYPPLKATATGLIRNRKFK